LPIAPLGGEVARRAGGECRLECALELELRLVESGMHVLQRAAGEAIEDAPVEQLDDGLPFLVVIVEGLARECGEACNRNVIALERASRRSP
jgi:hypothetical protein